MNRRFTARAAAALCVMAACGCASDAPYCGAHELLRDQRSGLCLSAHELAKRGTTSIIASQAELEQAELLVRQAFEALRPAFARVPVAASWNQERGLVTLIVTNPAIEAAWAGGLGPTTYPELDRVAAELDAWRFEYGEHFPAGHVASFWSNGAASALNVQRAVQAVPGVEVYLVADAPVLRSSDIIDEGLDPVDGERRVVFTVGWGDCMAGCANARFWRTKIAADGTARVVEEWGDVVPEWLASFLAETPEYL
ncbi:MAG: hypothetical protein IPH44_10365 [Myxococcales bacterium]|nr:hypothetical protein [Myxococcales bacterium]MBK7195821.1 hypothetical protein [Myxococcales bacterium]MBP6849385.1 hypothetical protein [Kofleriaceae bacterium]